MPSSLCRKQSTENEYKQHSESPLSLQQPAECCTCAVQPARAGFRRPVVVAARCDSYSFREKQKFPLCRCSNPQNLHWSSPFLKTWSHKESPARLCATEHKIHFCLCCGNTVTLSGCTQPSRADTIQGSCSHIPQHCLTSSDNMILTQDEAIFCKIAHLILFSLLISSQSEEETFLI